MKDYKELSKRSFNQKAGTYLGTHDHKVTAHLKNAALVDIQPSAGEKLLDIGCGIGDLLSGFSKRANSSDLYGIDYADNMIHQAKKNLVGVDLSIGDAENLPYDNDSFDYVVTCAAFHHLPNPVRALTEMKRVLKKDGRVFIYDYTVPCGLRYIVNFFIRFSPEGDYKIYSGKELKRMLERTGFRDVSDKKLNSNGFCVNAHK